MLCCMDRPRGLFESGVPRGREPVPTRSGGVSGWVLASHQPPPDRGGVTGAGSLPASGFGNSVTPVRVRSGMRDDAITTDGRTAHTPAAPVRNESELLARLRAGDNEAYEELVRENIARMLAVARRITRNEDDAQEAVQDAFLSAFRKISEFDGRSALSTWMHRIVVNACLMKLRSKRRRPERSIEDMLPAFREDGHFARSPRDNVADVRERGLEELEARELVERALDRLPEAHRTVIILRDIEELDTAEAAEMLGVTVDALKQRLHRARLALSRVIDELMEPAHGGA